MSEVREPWAASGDDNPADPGRTTADAARKRVAEWKDDPQVQKPDLSSDHSNEADTVPPEEGEE